MSNKKSLVWKNFMRESKDTARCLICSTILRCAGGTTTALASHLKTKHKIDLTPHDNGGLDNKDIEDITKRGLFKYDFIQKETLEELLAKCAAYDGFSVNSIRKSSAIKGFLAQRGYSIPKSGNTIKN